MENERAAIQKLVPILVLAGLLGCSSGPPKSAKVCGVTEKQFEEAWNDATRMEPYSARTIGKCDLLNDDAGNVSVSTPEHRQRLKTKFKLDELERQPASPKSFSTIQLNGGTISLAVKHEIIPEKGQAKVHYKQRGEEFCVDERGLSFTPSLDLGPDLTAVLEVQSRVPASKYFAESSVGFDITKVTSFKRLAEDSGQFVIDISTFHQNKRLILGYLAVEFYPCSQIYGKDNDPLITPVVYRIKLK